ncbi:MAG: CvpA family protein [Oscillospiraceae bacterium]|nr:CvpA family protein [Oscillospiraceae bacterium]
MNNPSTIIDIGLVVVLLISVVRAYIDGFFTSVIRLIGNLGSLFGAWYVASTYSQPIFDSLLRNSLITRSYSYLQQTARNIDIETALSSVIGKWPQEFVNTILQKTQDSLSVLLSPDMDSAVFLVDQFIAPIVVACISVVIFIVLFIAIRVVCALLAKMFKTVNKVPILGFANRLAGGLSGFVIGGVNIILLSFLFSIIVIITGDSLSWLNSQVISQSQILALTGMINPFLP